MSRKATKAPTSRKPPAVMETSQSIEAQTRAFLKSGKKIEVIQSGVSGIPSLAATRHIKLDNKSKWS